MNEFDHLAMERIQQHYQKHGKYPPHIEVTSEFWSKMTCAKFCFMPEPDWNRGQMLTLEEMIQKQYVYIVVYVMPIGDFMYVWHPSDCTDEGD